MVCDGALYKSSPIKTKGRGVEGKLLNCYTLAKNFKPYFDKWMECRKENNVESEWLFYNELNPNEQMNTSTIDGWYNEFTKIMGKDFYMHSMRHALVVFLGLVSHLKLSKTY